MNQALFSLVEDWLTGETAPTESVARLVLGACLGEGALDAAIAGDGVPQANAPGAAAERPPDVFLSSIEVEAFRGIGPRVTLDISPGPGLTLVVGRNGSGKSSLAEALELLLTGSNHRWEKKKGLVWKEDWRNLHSPGAAEIVGVFAREGHAQPLRLTRHWPADAGLDESALPGAPGHDLGWKEALDSFRPFLSYSELGSMFDEGPTVLHDALSSILGLDDLTDAQKRLQQARLEREKVVKAAKDTAAPLRDLLAESGDERSGPCSEALSQKQWDLEAIELVLAGATDGADPEAALTVLRELASLVVPDTQAIKDAADRLEAAQSEVSRLAGTGAGRAHLLAGLLQSALDLHRGHDARDLSGVFTAGRARRFMGGQSRGRGFPSSPGGCRNERGRGGGERRRRRGTQAPGVGAPCTRPCQGGGD